MVALLSDKMVVLLSALIAVVLAALAVLIRSYLFSCQKRKKTREINQMIADLSMQKQLLEAQIRTSENRQEYYAKALHQDIGNLNVLAATQVSSFLDDIEEYLEEEERAVMRETVELMKLTQTKFQNYCYGLSPILLPITGLDNALDILLRLECHKTKIRRIIFMNQPNVRIAIAKELYLYRITQEVVSNIIRHAKPDNLHLSQRYEKQVYSITLFHDGQGILQPQFEELSVLPYGNGLKNIRSLIQVSGAEVEFAHEEGEGYTITISIHAQEVDKRCTDINL